MVAKNVFIGTYSKQRFYRCELLHACDFATVGKPTVVNNGGTKKIGDSSLTIEEQKKGVPKIYHSGQVI